MRSMIWLVRLCALLVPPAARPRWIEEWHAEITHAREQRSFVGAIRFAAGSVRDARAVRREIRSRVSSGPRRPFHAFGQDVRYAIRGILAARMFAISVVASLAVGIAATSASFGFLHSVMFRTFPDVSDQEGLIRVSVKRGCGWPGCWISSSTRQEYDILRESLPSVSAVSASASGTAAIRIGTEAHAVRASAVSTNYFTLLGIRPALGRAFSEDEGASPKSSVAVISSSLWRRSFASDPNVLGRFIEVAGRPVQIVGVTPRFAGMAKGNMEVGGDYGVELWVPFDLAPLFVRSATYGGGRVLPANEYDIEYLARLNPAATVEQAQADAAVATARVKAARPDVYADGWVEVTGAWINDPSDARRMLATFMLVPVIVLAIACVNAANLLLARGNERARDVAVRLAVGASRWRIIRQLLTESLLLSLIAGALAIPFMWWLLALAQRAVGMPVTLNVPALIFIAAASLGCAIAFGLAPALRSVTRGTVPLGSSRPGDAGPGRLLARRILVVVQVALSLALLATGTQAIGAVHALYASTGAVEPGHVVLASFDLRQLQIGRAEGETFYSSLLERARRLPDVQDASLARRGALWTWGRGIGNSPIIAWRTTDSAKDGALYLGGYVSGDLFRTVGLRVLEGRSLLPEDATPRPSVAVVSRAFADEVLDGHAVGKTIRVAARGQKRAQAVDVRIVGVIEAARDPGYTKLPLRTVYVASPLDYEPALTLCLRVRSRTGSIVPALTSIVREIHPRVPIAEVVTLQEQTERRYFEERMTAQGITLLGVIALALATAGLYAVVSFLVTARRRELGVRVALGATPAGIQQLVLRQSGRLAAVGSAIGFASALVLSAIVRANLVGTPGINPLLFLLSAVILIAAMGSASFIPARRASRVDPITVLRQE
jgi:predicted permease